jgi:hypothetical protein
MKSFKAPIVTDLSCRIESQPWLLCNGRIGILRNKVLNLAAPAAKRLPARWREGDGNSLCKIDMDGEREREKERNI